MTDDQNTNITDQTTEEVVAPAVEEPAQAEEAPVATEEPVTTEETPVEEVQEDTQTVDEEASDMPAETETTTETETPAEQDADVAEEATTSESEEQTTQNTDTPTNRDTDIPASEATETPAADATPDNPNARWYVVHTYSGHENKVAATLKQRIESEHLQEKILGVLVPVQDKIEIKGGKKVNIKEKIFPGYILVKMVLDDISWLAVRTTQGVTSFVGMGNKPTPISEKEVQTIIKFTQTETPTYKQVFMVDDTVKIVDGPFAEFIGKIDSVDEERGKVKVLVSIFGRETPVELDFLQVQKI